VLVTPEYIKQLLAHAQPFTLHMVSGRRFDVSHPDYALLTPSAQALVLVADDWIEYIPLAHIESINQSTSAGPRTT